MSPKEFNKLPMKDRVGILEDMNKKHIDSIDDYEYAGNDKQTKQGPTNENDFDDEMFSDSIYLS